jgi:hypothetical protein
VISAIGAESSLVAIADIRGFKWKRGHGPQPTSETMKAKAVMARLLLACRGGMGSIKAEAPP